MQKHLKMGLVESSRPHLRSGFAYEISHEATITSRGAYTHLLEWLWLWLRPTLNINTFFPIYTHLQTFTHFQPQGQVSFLLSILYFYITTITTTAKHIFCLVGQVRIVVVVVILNGTSPSLSLENGTKLSNLQPSTTNTRIFKLKLQPKQSKLQAVSNKSIWILHV